MAELHPRTSATSVWTTVGSRLGLCWENKEAYFWTTVGSRLGPSWENKEVRANRLASAIQCCTGINLSPADALVLLRLNAIDPDVKELLMQHQVVMLECIMAAFQDRAINSRKE